MGISSRGSTWAEKKSANYSLDLAAGHKALVAVLKVASCAGSQHSSVVLPCRPVAFLAWNAVLCGFCSPLHWQPQLTPCTGRPSQVSLAGLADDMTLSGSVFDTIETAMLPRTRAEPSLETWAANLRVAEERLATLVFGVTCMSGTTWGPMGSYKFPSLSARRSWPSASKQCCCSHLPLEDTSEFQERSHTFFVS